MRRKGKGNDTAIFLCFLVGIPLYLLVNYSNLIIILLAIIAVIIIIKRGVKPLALAMGI